MARTSEAIRSSPRLRKLLGAALSVVAIASLLVSIVAVYEVWSVRARVTQSVDGGLALLADMLTTSDRALRNVDDQLVVAQDALASAEKAARNVAGMMGATRDSLKTSSSIVGTELPASVRATQTAIQNAQSSARLIDNVLAGLAAIPLLGIDYRPDAPLSDQLGNMARSLDRLPGLSTDLGKQIDATAAELGSAQTETTTLADTLRKSRAGFAESRAAVAEFGREVATASEMVARARDQLPAAINWIAIGLTFVLGWLTLVQIAALVLGFEWLLADNLADRARAE